MKMKNQFWPITCSIILVIIGIFLLAFPDIGDFVDNTNNILYVVMYIYAGIKLLEYCFSKSPGDYEDLFMCMASVIAGTSGIIFSLEDTSKVLSLTLFGWLILVAVIKLIKIDYLIQQKNSMFNVKIVLFSAFVLAGILSCVNIFYEISNQTIMLGFFFLINGLLELAYPLIENYHLSHLKDEPIEASVGEKLIGVPIKEEKVIVKENSTKKVAPKKEKTKKITEKKKQAVEVKMIAKRTMKVVPKVENEKKTKNVTEEKKQPVKVKITSKKTKKVTYKEENMKVISKPIKKEKPPKKINEKK